LPALFPPVSCPQGRGCSLAPFPPSSPVILTAAPLTFTLQSGGCLDRLNDTRPHATSMYPPALFDHTTARIMVNHLYGKKAACFFEQMGANSVLAVNKNKIGLPGDEDYTVVRAVYFICVYAPTVEAHLELYVSYYKRTLNGGLRVNGQDAFTLKTDKKSLKTDKVSLKTDKKTLGFAAKDAARLAELRAVFSVNQLSLSFSYPTMGSINKAIKKQKVHPMKVLGPPQFVRLQKLVSEEA